MTTAGYDEPQVETLEDARFWIAVMHRRTCQDAKNHYRLMMRVAYLEQPWWRRPFRKWMRREAERRDA